MCPSLVSVMYSLCAEEWCQSELGEESNVHFSDHSNQCPRLVILLSRTFRGTSSAKRSQRWWLDLDKNGAAGKRATAHEVKVCGTRNERNLMGEETEFIRKEKT